MAIQLHTFNTTDEFTAFRWDFIKRAEAVKKNPYVDHVGVPTIGVGFNLMGGTIRDLVFKALGWVQDDARLTTDADKASNNAFIDQLTAAVNKAYAKNDTASLQSAIQKILEKRAQKLSSYSFINTSMVLAEDQMPAIFLLAVPVYQDRVRSALGLSVTEWPNESREMVALTSMAYQGTLAGIRRELKAAIANNDRAEVWYLIRYRAQVTGPGDFGRHFAEAQTFGLYDGSNTGAKTPSLVESRKIYQMLTLHREEILIYENAYGAYGVSNASSRFSLDANDLGLANALDPAKATLLADLNIDINPTDYLSTDIILDPGRDSVSEAFNLVHVSNLTGSNRNDILIGGAGNDTLSGGGGSDVYVYQTGDGTDHLTDTDGLNKIYVGTTQILGTSENSTPGIGSHVIWNENGGEYVYIWNPDDHTLTIRGSALGGAQDKIILDGINSLQDAKDRYGIDLVLKPKVAITEKTSNPFLDALYESADEVGNTIENGAKRIGLAFNEPLKLGDKLKVTIESIDGVGQDLIKWVIGDEVVDFSSGSITLNATEGQSFLSFAILEQGNIDANASVTFKAVIESTDDNGNPITTESNLYTLNINDITQDIQTSHDITGDPQIHTDTIAPGGQGPDWRVIKSYNYEYATDGDGHQVLVSYTVDYFLVDGDGNPTEGGKQKRDDILYGTAANDHIKGGGGRDFIFGKDGNDLIEGGADGDMVDGGAGNDNIFADSKVSADDAIAQGNAGGGTGQQGDWLVGGSGEDIVVGGAGNDVLMGGGGKDLLIGGAGDDDILGDTNWMTSSQDWTVTDEVDVRLFKPAAGDTMPGDASDDVIHAGSGNDHAWGGLGDDVIYGEGGDDKLSGNDGHDIILGGDGNDKLWGDGVAYAGQVVVAEGDDYIDGGEGDDEIWGEGGNDTLMGGNGHDQLAGDVGDDYLDGEGGDDTLFGGDGNDIVLGGNGIDQLAGDVGDDYVDGEDGDDDLFGGDGNDFVLGGMGNDTINGNDGDDELYGEEGDDKLYGGEGANYLDGGDGDDTLNSGGPDSSLFGGAGDDDISAAGGGNYLDGEDGNDTLAADGGGNTLFGGSGDDSLSAAGGDNYLDGGDGINSLVADGGFNTLLTGAGDDTLSSGGGSSYLNGGEGANLLIADTGNNTLISGSGADTLSAGGGNNYLDGGEGFNTLVADGGSNTLIGGSGNDSLSASGGNNYLDGGAGNDYLVANGFNNTLMGGDGDDVLVAIGIGNYLNGGSGNDHYALAPGFGIVHIDDPDFDNVVQLNMAYVGSGIVFGLGSLKISFPNGDELHIDGFDPEDPYNTCSIKTFQFNDRVLSLQDVLDIGGENLYAPMLGADINGTSADDVLVGTDQGEYIYGMQGNDSVSAGAGFDVIEGGTGDDIIDGGSGADVMKGGAGNDTFVVDNVGDRVIENTGEGWDSVQSSITYTLGNNVENLTLLGTDDINGTGNTLENYISGNDGNNTLSGGAGDDWLAGGAGADTLIGGTGNDTLDGGAGADSMAAGMGNDYYLVNDAGDVVSENINEGIDTVQSTVSYVLGENLENLNLQGVENLSGIGNALDNRISGNSGDNTLEGGAGNDTIFGYAGVDTMIGGTGDDTYFVDDSADVIVENIDEGMDIVSSTANYTLSDNVENLALFGQASVGTGSAQDNVITGYNQNGFDNINYVLSGMGGNDTLTGNRLGDILNGGTGADIMTGGLGNDTYVVDNTGDQVVESLAGEAYSYQQYVWTGYNYQWRTFYGTFVDTDTVNSSISYTLGNNLENLYLTGAENIDGNGNELNNVINGNVGANILQGMYGNDILDGGAGADVMYGGVGSDTYFVDNVDDQVIEDTVGHMETTSYWTGYGYQPYTYYQTDYEIVYSSANFTLGANLEDLYLTGSDNLYGAGNDLNNVIAGNDGDNILMGEAGDDYLDGGLGNDTLNGGAGNDTYNITDAGDTIIEDADNGFDRVYSSVDITLSANIEDLSLNDGAIIGIGNESDNSIRGNDADNLLSGEGGNDYLDGGSGNDTISGGDGNDNIQGGDDTYVWDDYGEHTASNADTLYGGAGDDNIDGGSDNDTIFGGTGNDVLFGGYDGGEGGGPNDDTIYGDEGDDSIDGGYGADLLAGGDGNDSIYGGGDGWSDYYFDYVTQSDVIISSNDTLDGGNGDDYLDGGSGEDILLGGSGNDELYGGDGYRSVFDWASDDYVIFSNNDYLDGGEGDDYMDGEAGNDILFGGTGDDQMYGGNDDGVYNGGYGGSYGNDYLDGQAGDDYLDGQAGDDILLGGIGNDEVYGSEGNDILAGGEGADSLYGGDGNDVLYSSHFNDIPSWIANGSGVTVPRPDVTLTVNSTEDNGAIPLATEIGLANNYTLQGSIGDGPYSLAGNGWDYDFYSLGYLSAGQVVTASMFTDFDTVIGLYDSQGNLVTMNDDANWAGGSSNDLDASFSFTLNASDTYYLAITDIDNWLPYNPFDSASLSDSSPHTSFGGDYTATVNIGKLDFGASLIPPAYFDSSVSIDSLAGGTGDDTYYVDGNYEIVEGTPGITECGDPIPTQRMEWVTDEVIENAGEGYDTVLSSGSFVMGDNVEELHLTFDATMATTDPQRYADMITYGQDGTGNDLDNVIIGNELNNRLDGGLGGDYLEGGAGNDTYVIDQSDDIIVEQTGGGIDTVESSISYSLADSNLENLTLLDGAVWGAGNAADNVIIGNAGFNELYGGDGNDTLIGGSGSDELYGGAGNDRYVFRMGDGEVWLQDDQGSDTVFIGNDLTIADMEASRDGDNLTLSINGTNDSITIGNWFAQAEGVSRIEFCDTPALDRAGIEALFNVAPTANADEVVTDEDTGLITIAAADLLANDTDPDAGDTLTIDDFDSITTEGNTISMDSAGDLVLDISDKYQSLGAGQTETDSFVYTVSDMAGASSSTTVDVIIEGVNDAPVNAKSIDGQQTDQDAVFSFTIPDGTFTDIDNGDVLTYSAMMEGGTDLPDWLTFDADTRTFSGAAGNADVATLSVLVTATDTGLLSASSVFTLEVNNVNDAPVANDDSGVATEDGGAVQLDATTLLANDTDPDFIHDDVLNIVEVSQAVSGAAVSLVNGNVQYDIGNLYQSLAQGQTTTDTFSYTVSDKAGATSTATVSMTITGVNDAVVTANDEANVQEDGSIIASGNVLTNDTDVDEGTILTVSNAGTLQGNYGQLILNEDGGYSYQLDNNSDAVQRLMAGQTVKETFGYQAFDGYASTPATLTVTITGSNDGPIAVGDSATVGEDSLLTVNVDTVLANDSDVDEGDSKSLVGVDAASSLGATVSLINGQVIYDHGGRFNNLMAGQSIVDSFTYTMTDSAGATSTATVNVTVLGVNDGPTANADNAETNEDTAKTSISVASLIANDIDPDTGDTLVLAGFDSITALGNSIIKDAIGNLVFDIGGRYQYLAQGQAVTDTFSYSITDTSGAVSTARVALTIVGNNDAPVTASDSANAQEDVTVTATGNVLTNDSDADQGAVLTVANAGTFSGSYGQLVLNANGSYSYALNNSSLAVQSLAAGQVVTETFAYQATDGMSITPSKLTVTLTGTNDAPVTTVDVASVQEDVSVIATGNVLTNDSDIDQGTVLTIANAGTFSGSYGQLVLNANGSYSYALNNSSLAVQSLATGQVVTETFTYQAYDGFVTTPSTLSISITGTNDAPIVAIPLTAQTIAQGQLFTYALSANSFTDVDIANGDKLSYAATLANGTALPAWLTFNAVTQTFSGTPGVNDLASLSVKVVATDTGGLSASSSFTLAVNSPVITGTCGNDCMTGTDFDNTMYGLGGNDHMQGLGGDDILDGGTGYDTMIGGKGNDTYVVDNSCDVVTENANEGIDTVQSSISYTLGANVENLTLTGTTAINGTGNTLSNVMLGNAAANTMSGGSGNDLLNGGAGNDILKGDGGNDVLEGGTGNDTLSDSAGKNLFNGGAGTDTLIGNSGNELFIGGTGNDTITTGSGADIIAFNKGDGQDTVVASTGADNTISLGGGIKYANLAMSKSGNNLIFSTGNGEQITLQNWYASINNHSVKNLQIVLDSSTYNAASADTLLNHQVQSFNFAALATSFDQARAANPTLTAWSMTDALLTAHLAGSDTAALGGDLAFQYGQNNTLAGIGLASAQTVMNDANFGTTAQTLKPLNELQVGVVKLG